MGVVIQFVFCVSGGNTTKVNKNDIINGLFLSIFIHADRVDMFQSFLSIFMHEDRVDMILMVLGFIGAMGDGVLTPLMIFLTARLMNTIRNASKSHFR